MNDAAKEVVQKEHLATADVFMDALSGRDVRWSESARDWIFRGHADDTWKLVPTLYRSSDVFREFGLGAIDSWWERTAALETLLEGFLDGLHRAGMVIPAATPVLRVRNRISGGAEPRFEALPLAALAQHHGLPTTLLDWTRRGWTAAYFAAFEGAKGVGSSKNHGRVAVWALSRGDFARTSGEEIFYDAPAATNPNLRAQDGTFTRCLDPELLPFEEHLKLPKPDSLRCLTLPTSEAGRLLRLLSLEGVNGASLFPGVEGVVRLLRERRYWDPKAEPLGARS